MIRPRITPPSAIVRMTILFLIAITHPLNSWAWEGKATSIVDGDTIKAEGEGYLATIRLYGIDTPEMSQQFGGTARQYLNDLIAGKHLVVEPTGKDRYERTVALIYIKGEKTSVNEILVRSGYAWVYDRYCDRQECQEWKKLQESAKTQKIGLWALSGNKAPWEYRNGPQQAEEPKATTPAVREQEKEITVYITRTGTKYHRGSCSYLRKSKIPISLKDAIANGYGPCSRCKPPRQ